MSPMAFFATASGLMIERVRSTAIFRLRQDKSEQIQNSNTRTMSEDRVRALGIVWSILASPRSPIERERGLVARRSEPRIDTRARYRGQRFVAVDARQSGAIPCGDASLAQQVGDVTCRCATRQPQPFARRAGADGDARRGKAARGDPFAPRRREDQRAVRQLDDGRATPLAHVARRCRTMQDDAATMQAEFDVALRDGD